MSQTLTVALQAAREAGQLLSDYFHNGVLMRSKGAADLVSDADLHAERRIAEIIHAVFPHHSILGEELHTAASDAEDLWVVDPLDGTTNFAHRIPHFAVSIARYHRGTAQCGVVFNPLHNELYVAERGRGATCNGVPVHVGPQTSLSEVLLGVGFYYDRGAMMEATLAAVRDCFRQQIHGIRRFGTASLDLAQVATGAFGGFFEFQLSPWDFAAGQLILEEAGGRMTTCDGSPVPLAKTSVLASNGHLHDQLLPIVRRHLQDAFPQ